MNQSVEETKRRLANVSSYRHHLDGVQQADFSGENISNWKLLLPLGFRAEFTLNETMVDDQTVMFKSGEGNLQITGMLSFHAVKNNLTEVDVVVNYTSSSVLFNVLDHLLNVGDHYFVSQLRRIRAHFEGTAAPAEPLVNVYHGFKQVTA